MTKSSDILPKEISADQAKDTGMAMILLCFIWLYFFKEMKLILFPGILLLLNMTVPSIYTWPARLWFGLAHLMGTVMTKVLLSGLYFVILVPIALVRKVFGADAMLLKQWKQGSSSVFQERNHLFVTKDMEVPY